MKTRIRSLLDDLQSKADPVLLNRYRAVFRQQVSFFKRSYLAAYLLLLTEPGAGKGRPARGDSRRGSAREGIPRMAEDSEKNRDARRALQKAENRDESPRVLPDDEAVRLFFNIGRSRKVFPREILGIIGSKAQVSREDVGAIRIFDNYSFVQVRNTLADTVIEALNGQILRGKTLAVNYARAKKDQEDSIESAGEEETEAEDSGSEGEIPALSSTSLVSTKTEEKIEEKT